MSLRQYERLAVNIAATIYNKGTGISARLENISITGARLSCFTHRLEIGDTVNLAVLGELYKSSVVWIGTLAFGVNFASPLVKGPLHELLARDPRLLREKITPGYPLEARPDRKMI